MHHLLLLVVLLGWILFLYLAWWIALPLYLVAVAITLIIYWKALKAQRSPLITGTGVMIGKQAMVIQAESNELEVQYEGEIWKAISEVPVQPGQRVVIKGVDGLVLKIAPLPPD